MMAEEQSIFRATTVLSASCSVIPLARLVTEILPKDVMEAAMAAAAAASPPEAVASIDPVSVEEGGGGGIGGR